MVEVGTICIQFDVLSDFGFGALQFSKCDKALLTRHFLRNVAGPQLSLSDPTVLVIAFLNDAFPLPPIHIASSNHGINQVLTDLCWLSVCKHVERRWFSMPTGNVD
ncbi:hypothetical protein VNO77_12480 [Canavalia gladiata]|uniref:Uncharacterized protein n=1 Tax=Canavalia gladiata TaxID=3824 RepID=A0AAN9M0R8_CANGL